MSIDDIKRALWAAEQRQYQIEKLKEQIADLKQQQQCLRELQNVPLNGMPKGKCKKDVVAQKTVEILELENRLYQTVVPMLQELFLEQSVFEMVLLKTLKKEEYIVVKKRYFERKSFYCMARELYCSKSTCYRWHQRALEKLKKVL